MAPDRYPDRIRVDCRYGAPMGRYTPPGPFIGRVRSRRVRLNAGAYDRGGAYWGFGPPALYYVYGSKGGQRFVRAENGQAAITKATSENGGHAQAQ